MNPRQWRGVVLLVVSIIGAGGVFTAVSGYTASVARQLGPTRPVLSLARDVPAYQPLTAADVVVTDVPRMYTSDAQLASADQIGARVPSIPLAQGSRLQFDSLVPVPAAGPGEREVTVNAGVEASVAAGLGPEDHVDIIAAYADPGRAKPYARIVASGVRVLRVRTLANASRQDGAGEALRGDTIIAVTFALPPRRVADVVLAQTIAKTLRLALVPRGSGATHRTTASPTGGSR